MASAVDGWVVNGQSRHFTPGKALEPIIQRLGGPRGQSGRVRTISPLPEFENQTVQRYADCAIPAAP
jgi:hypothetical protein